MTITAINQPYSLIKDPSSPAKNLRTLFMVRDIEFLIGGQNRVSERADSAYQAAGKTTRKKLLSPGLNEAERWEEARFFR